MELCVRVLTVYLVILLNTLCYSLELSHRHLFLKSYFKKLISSKKAHLQTIMNYVINKIAKSNCKKLILIDLSYNASSNNFLQSQKTRRPLFVSKRILGRWSRFIKLYTLFKSRIRLTIKKNTY